jgi:hypothetical protein
MKRYFLTGALCAVGFASIQQASANPIRLTPDADITPWVLCGKASATSEIVAAIKAFDSELVALYKSNQGGEDEWTFANSYTTTYQNDDLADADARINWDGGAASFIADNKVYAVAKDGNSDPNWYLFDLGTWDGKSSIEFEGFFASDQNTKNISHVAIYGKNVNVTGGGTTTNLPDGGTTAAMLGLSLLGMGFLFRHKA